MTGSDLASGKGHRDENFPVASILIKREYRAPIMAFYRFARAADDIADHPGASADEKLSRLAAMRAGLDGSGDAHEAVALHHVMSARKIDPVHARELLDAFVQDVMVERYQNWEALVAYCRLSAMPVGRFVLDVHGEDRSTWPASDALCAALQIINHLQDCAKDYRAIGRVYLPLDTLKACGASVGDLAASRATPPLREAIGRLAVRTQDLLDESAGFAGQIRDRRLAAEVAVIHRLAVSLNQRLMRRDPLSERVHHRPWQAALLAGGAVMGQWMRKAA